MDDDPARTSWSCPGSERRSGCNWTLAGIGWRDSERAWTRRGAAKLKRVNHTA